MARSVPPWLWGVLIRDHGPKDATTRLCLYALRTFMDNSGYAFPSQASIAKAACVTEYTAGKKLNDAHRLHWVGIFTHGRSGQGWRRLAYQACVPDHVAIPDQHEHLVETWASQVGEVEVPNDVGDLDTPVTGTSPTSAHKVPNLSNEGAQPQHEKVPNDVGTKSSFLSSHRKSSGEGSANALPSSLESLKGEIRSGAILKPLAKPTLTDQELFGMAERLRRTQGMDVVTEIVATLSTDYAGVDGDRLWTVIRRYDPAQAKGHRKVVV